MRLRGVLPVGRQEPAGEVCPAEVLQVHRKEGSVVEHVAPAEPGVELHAVEDPGAVVEAEDVLGEQVAVPVDDPSFGDPVREQPVPALQVGHRLATDPGDRVAVDEPSGEGCGLLEVGGPEHGQVLDRAGEVDGRSAGGPGVECGQAPRHRRQVRPVEVRIGDHRCQPAIGRQTAHHDQVVDGGPALVDDVVDPEVHIRGQPPVELHLPPAVGQAQLAGREVQERGRDRLAHLVHALAHEEQHRDVGLHHSSALHEVDPSPLPWAAPEANVPDGGPCPP